MDIKKRLTKEYSNKKVLHKKNNDECYTPYRTIAKELDKQGSLGKFKDKSIICPCDWQPNNQFVKYLNDRKEEFGIKSITASGYNPKTGKGIKFQDIDYSKYDICVTNPPFSLMDEFVKCLLGQDYNDKKCDFIFLAPFMNRVTPNIGLPLMLGKLYLGFGRDLNLEFDNFIDDSGNKQKKNVACDWITSFPDAQDEVNKNSENLPNIKYEDYKDDFLIYERITMKDGTHPIRVTGNDFPEDYDGWMLGPVNLFDRKLDTRKYEWYGTDFKGYFNTQHPELNPCNHPLSNQMMFLNGRQAFHGILFRKKKDQI